MAQIPQAALRDLCSEASRLGTDHPALAILTVFDSLGHPS